MKLHELQLVKPGDLLYADNLDYVRRGRHTGTPIQARVTSVKPAGSWKRDPARFELRLKYGLYDYFEINSEMELSHWHKTPERAIESRENVNSGKVKLFELQTGGSRNEWDCT